MSMPIMMSPPLALYVHLPWCARKCPYCDFNSHTLTRQLPEKAYIATLLDDLKYDLSYWQIDRPITSLFIGGGTPSLFSGEAIHTLLGGILPQTQPSRTATPSAMGDYCEITLEANPNTSDQTRFAEYRKAGVNRLSIGVQSFSDPLLQAIGRLHDAATAKQAIEAAKQAGFSNFNIDLMYGLPGQSIAQALSDIRQAHAFAPTHLSWYQLTLEPNTPFHHTPPQGLPNADTLWEMDQQGRALLAELGYQQYEVSAFCKPNYRCQHNVNYWQFGDYLGIGAGAHAKITTAPARIFHQLSSRDDEISGLGSSTYSTLVYRCFKHKHPKRYSSPNSPTSQALTTRPRAHPYCQSISVLPQKTIIFEFLLNRLRMFEPIDTEEFTRKTGAPFSMIEPTLEIAKKEGLILRTPRAIHCTDQGKQYLNTLLQLFL